MVARIIEVTRRGRQGEQGNPGSTAFDAVTTAGSSTVYTLTNGTPIVTYDDGYGVTIDAHATNGAAPTMNVDGLGAVPIKKLSGGSSVAIVAGDMVADNFYMIHYSAVESAFILFGTDINVVKDLTPQSGGPYDTNSFAVYWSQGADVASATELLVLTDGNSFYVTGTTTITTIEDTADAFGIGSIIKLRFNGILTLTHHATNLVLLGGANITTAAGDWAEFVKGASGDWEMTSFNGISATADWQAGTSDKPSLTRPADTKAAIDAQVPALFSATGSAQMFACRAWVNFVGTGTVAINESGNVSSITDNGLGKYAVNYTTDMEDANYCVVSSGATATSYTTNPGPVEATVGAYVLSTSSCDIASTRPGDGGDIAVPQDLELGYVSIFR